MAETILQHPFVVNILLPFILVFTVVFAVLQKTEILGKGKKQIDALVALVMGLIVVAYANATGIIVNLSVFMAVSLVILLVFMILIGITFKQGEFKVEKNIQNVLIAIISIAIVVALLNITGYWDDLVNAFSGGDSLVVNVISIVLVVVVVWFVGGFGKKEDK